MSEQQRAFLRRLEEDPDDDATRLVYADWLDDNDEPEEADRMRRWRESKDWLVALAARAGQTCLDYPDPGDEWRDIAFDDLVKAGKDWVERGEDWVKRGEETPRGLMHGGDALDLYWRHWSVVTGLPSPEPDRWGDRSPFSCTC